MKISGIALGNWLTDLTGKPQGEVAKATIKLAYESGINLSILALAWILRRDEISCAIVGASNPAQLENSMKASGFALPKDILERIDGILGFHRFERHVG